MKKLIVLVLLASFTGAVIAQQAPTQAGPAQAHVDKDKKEKKKHHHHRRDHKDDKKK
jgi:Ni/Co efflux regulator RcnB